jgi:hypothetical protein
MHAWVYIMLVGSFLGVCKVNLCFGFRPMHGQMGHPGGRGPPMGWRPLGAPGVGPPPQAGSTPYGAPAGPRGGPVAGVPQMVS